MDEDELIFSQATMTGIGKGKHRREQHQEGGQAQHSSTTDPTASNMQGATQCDHVVSGRRPHDDAESMEIDQAAPSEPPAESHRQSSNAADAARDSPVGDEEENKDADAITLDPKNSERQYYRDPFTSLKREIWRPGDADGDRATEYHDRVGPPVPLENRWRLYQSRTGHGPIKRGVNEPPKFVMLDDRAAYELLISDVPRSHLSKFWPHDFAGIGIIRSRRPHRGRGAIGDPDAEGDDRFHFTPVGKSGERYYLTGQAGYKPIVYHSAEAEPSRESQSSAKTSLEMELPRDARGIHGHNQYTPKDQLVKYGAPHFGRTWKRYKPRVNAFLKRDRSPSQPLWTESVYGLEPKHGISDAKNLEQPLAGGAVQDEDGSDEDSLWVQPDDPVARKKQKLMNEYEPVDPSQFSEETQSDGLASRSHRSTTTMTPNRMSARSSPIRDTDDETNVARLQKELEDAREQIEQQEERISELENAYNYAQDTIERLEDEIRVLKGI